MRTLGRATGQELDNGTSPALGIADMIVPALAPGKAGGGLKTASFFSGALPGPSRRPTAPTVTPSKGGTQPPDSGDGLGDDGAAG